MKNYLKIPEIASIEKLIQSEFQGVLITDKNHNIIIANEAFCRIFEKKIEDIINTNLSTWIEQFDEQSKRLWNNKTSNISQKTIISPFYLQKKNSYGIKNFMVDVSVINHILIKNNFLIRTIWFDVTEHKK